MRELSELMGDAFEARARSLDGLTPVAEVAGLRSRVRRRRAVRHTVQAVAVLPVVAALAVGGWHLGSDREPAPVATPEPTLSPEPSPTPAPEVTETPEIVLGDPIDEPGLPTYYEMPDGLLEQTEPGWVLGTYTLVQRGPEPRYTIQADEEIVFLVSPEGVRFLAHRIPLGAGAGEAGATWSEHEFVDWRAGEPTAVVREVVHTVTADGAGEKTEPAGLMKLDLRTGSLSALAGDSAPTGFRSPLRLSPDGDLLLNAGVVTRVVDGTVLGSLDRMVNSGWCEAVGWWSSDTILARCLDDDANALEVPHVDLNPRLVTFDMEQLRTGEGTLLRSLSPGDPWPSWWGVEYVSDGVMVFEALALEPDALLAYSCPSGTYLLNGDRIERLPASDSHPDVELNIFEPHVIGRMVYVESTGGCSGDARPSILTSYDLDSRRFVELLGPPPRRDATEYLWIQGLTSYTVGR